MYQAATLFPLAFAAVSGQTIKQIGRYMLEQGVSMGLLEQVMASRTVFGSVYASTTIRYSNRLAVGMILLWSLSPLGGQAILRSLSITSRPVLADGVLSYFDSSSQPVFTDWTINSPTSAQMVPSLQTVLRSMYTAALLSSDSVKASPMDLWNHVKIPRTISGFSKSQAANT